MNVTSISVTSITISWNTPNGSVVTHSQVVWSVTSGIEGTSGNLTETSNYTIEQLDSNTIYNITVTVSNIAGSTNSQPIIVSTGIMFTSLYTILIIFLLSLQDKQRKNIVQLTLREITLQLSSSLVQWLWLWCSSYHR